MADFFDIKTIEIHINGNLYILSYEILMNKPDTLLYELVISELDNNLTSIEDYYLILKHDYTDIYFKYIIAWYYTDELYIPNECERLQYYKILDHFKILHNFEFIKIQGPQGHRGYKGQMGPRGYPAQDNQ